MPLKEHIILYCSPKGAEEPIPLRVVKNHGKINFRCTYLVQGTMRCTFPGKSECTTRKMLVATGAIRSVEDTLLTRKMSKNYGLSKSR